jgi:hypothetical protein
MHRVGTSCREESSGHGLQSFPGVGHLGEQESWGRRSAGRAGAGADEGFCCTVCGAAEGPPRRSKENTRSPPGRGVSGLTDTASETNLSSLISTIIIILYIFFSKIIIYK